MKLNVLVIRRVHKWFYVFDLMTGKRMLGEYATKEDARNAIHNWNLLKELTPYGDD